MDAKDKKLWKKLFKSKPIKPIPSLMEESRQRWNFDYGFEYGFLPFMNWSDKEIEEYLDENVRIKIVHSQYDCTGQLFTSFINWKRNPSGLISFVNHLGIDV